MAIERRELEERRAGKLGRMLGSPLPGESREFVETLAAEDRRMAEKGLVTLRGPEAEIFHKHIDDLEPEDYPARTEADRARMRWLRERGAARASEEAPTGLWAD